MTGGAAAGSDARDPGEGARRWIRERIDEAPARLGEAVDGILADLAASPRDEGPWDAMARAAVDALRSVEPVAGDRDAALELLAADALLTYAFQCAAEEGADLEATLEAWGPRGRLGEVAARAVADAGGEG